MWNQIKISIKKFPQSTVLIILMLWVSELNQKHFLCIKVLFEKEFVVKIGVKQKCQDVEKKTFIFF
jgi:hypothetical protein